jgi:thymidylate synthase (FAD)
MYNKILIGQSTPVLDQGYIQLIDYMGTDETIVNAARTSYGNEELHRLAELEAASEVMGKTVLEVHELGQHGPSVYHGPPMYRVLCSDGKLILLSVLLSSTFSSRRTELLEELKTKDEVLLRLLMRHKHGTPFEMCEVTFRIQIPMDAHRQFIRHRTASVNEYSTRYTEAIDAMQCTAPDQWRLQATDNKQGSSGYLTKWPEDFDDSQIITSVWNQDGKHNDLTPGEYLSLREKEFHDLAREIYQERLSMGIAKEQARKDLPLSTYTRLYWKCDLRNIFHFLGLRMDSHAQLEIRQYANAMAEFIKKLFPVAYKAFEDYQLNAVTFSAMEMSVINKLVKEHDNYEDRLVIPQSSTIKNKPDSMTKREWTEFLSKVDIK